MTRKFWIIALLFGALGTLLIRAEAFVFIVGTPDGEILSNQSSGTPVTWDTPMVLVNHTFGAPFDEAVPEAIAQWNGVNSRFEFQSQLLAGDPCAAPDDHVYARFMSDLCDRTWGPGVAGATVIFIEHSGSTSRIVDADILIREDQSWDVYDGPIRFPELDFRRVLLHELGHVLGLGHPDEGGQSVDAVMNSASTEFELQPDDKNGIIALYATGNFIGANDGDDGGAGSADLLLLGSLFIYGWFSIRRRRVQDR